MRIEDVKVVALDGLGKVFIPKYMTDGSVGADLHASESVLIEPGEFNLVKTGIAVELPVGIEAQIRPRSGLALKYGVTVLNSPGTIDSDYRGEIGVILINHGKSAFAVNEGDRIAQMVFAQTIRGRFSASSAVQETVRGSGGFGHTGV